MQTSELGIVKKLLYLFNATNPSAVMLKDYHIFV
jgi:hypothetical protein